MLGFKAFLVEEGKLVETILEGEPAFVALLEEGFWA